MIDRRFLFFFFFFFFVVVVVVVCYLLESSSIVHLESSIPAHHIIICRDVVFLRYEIKNR